MSRFDTYLTESYDTFEKKAYGKSHRIDLDMGHTGGRDIGTVSIWTKAGKWIKTINVKSEDEGIKEFKKACAEYNCVERKR